MGVYAVTGAASGMGRAVADKLTAEGHRVIGVDIQETDIVADLATAEGRRSAIDAVLTAADGRLDGAVLAAGLGPAPDPARLPVIAAVNYLGTVDLLEGWRPALAASGSARVVAFGSNSATTVPAVPRRAIAAFLAGDTERAVRAVKIFGKQAGPFVYAASKIAVSRWVRRHAVRPEWAGEGIRLNVIAPGAILTPLLERQLESPVEAKAIKAFPVPTGGFGKPEHIADWVCMMLSPSAEFLCGSVLFVDGGTDAYFRPDDWPRAVPLHRIAGYLRKFRGFSATRRAE
ncbi:SDR family oxidoreductase [Nocardia jinanensis]|uniref:NAD-dependent epimerase n=1 Tax=Nocardia jinanensis TaxID=382504 RepID=A0A917VWU0_9NOCA|nr:SDR family oxidoreductase [Nocardia jinanensis]GGL35539.1 NAD-dependent epimerase [Nocardia jinanensis]